MSPIQLAQFHWMKISAVSSTNTGARWDMKKAMCISAKMHTELYLIFLKASCPLN